MTVEQPIQHSPDSEAPVSNSGNGEVRPDPPVGLPHTSGDYLRIGELAEESGISIASLRRWANQGDLEQYRTPGGQRLFPRGALQRMLEKQTQKK